MNHQASQAAIRAASKASTSGESLKIVTLNCWGLWLVAKNRQQRISAICSWLRSTDADVVLLQEVFLKTDVTALAASAIKGGLQHSRSFQGGVLGGELVTLSRFPISESHFVQYSVAGNPALVHHGDFYAGKGFGFTRLDLPTGESLDVFNTHTCANYAPRRHQRGSLQVPRDDDGPIRLAQLFQLAQYISAVAGPNVILAGDLNSPPGSLEMAMLRLVQPTLVDAWLQLRPSDPGFTANTKNNTYTKSNGDPPVRIDYVMVKGIRAQHVDQFDRVCSDGISFSDHIGVAATVSFMPAPAVEVYASNVTAVRQPSHIADETLRVIRQGTQQYSKATYRMVGTSIVLAILTFSSAVFVIATTFSGKRRRPFLVSVLVLTQLLAAIAAALLFVTGFAGCGATHHALQQTQQEMLLCFSRGLCY